jgi:hypothetical protein
MRASVLIIVLAALLMSLLFMPAATAAPGISIQGYHTGGSFTPNDGSYPIPVGVTLEVRIWDDFYACSDATVNWGDGTAPDTGGTGSGFAQTYEHVYTAAGTYTITATQDVCPGLVSARKVIEVGGMGNMFDPSNPMFFLIFFALILAVVALILANARITPPRPRPGARPGSTPGAPQQNAPRPTPVPRLGYSGISANMTHHLVRLREVPPGAPVQYDPLSPPHIAMQFGKPTDIDQHVNCHACGTKLGYTVEGWFCMNPRCPLIGTGPKGFTRGTLQL